MGSEHNDSYSLLCRAKVCNNAGRSSTQKERNFFLSLKRDYAPKGFRVLGFYLGSSAELGEAAACPTSHVRPRPHNHLSSRLLCCCRCFCNGHLHCWPGKCTPLDCNSQALHADPPPRIQHMLLKTLKHLSTLLLHYSCTAAARAPAPPAAAGCCPSRRRQRSPR